MEYKDKVAVKAAITIRFGVSYLQEEVEPVLRAMFNNEFADEMWIEDIIVEVGEAHGR